MFESLTQACKLLTFKCDTYVICADPMRTFLWGGGGLANPAFYQCFATLQLPLEPLVIPKSPSQSEPEWARFLSKSSKTNKKTETFFLRLLKGVGITAKLFLDPSPIKYRASIANTDTKTFYFEKQLIYFCVGESNTS